MGSGNSELGRAFVLAACRRTDPWGAVDAGRAGHHGGTGTRARTCLIAAAAAWGTGGLLEQVTGRLGSLRGQVSGEDAEVSPGALCVPAAWPMAANHLNHPELQVSDQVAAVRTCQVGVDGCVRKQWDGPSSDHTPHVPGSAAGTKDAPRNDLDARPGVAKTTESAKQGAPRSGRQEGWERGSGGQRKRLHGSFQGRRPREEPPGESTQGNQAEAGAHRAAWGATAERSGWKTRLRGARRAPKTRGLLL